jgi:secreted Zn-dependent insulinase-like peptidase
MYINKIKQEGPQKRIYDELSKKYKIDFENITKQPAMSYANMLARSMNFNMLKDDSNVDNFLMTNYMYDNFDEEAVMESLKLLSPDNMWGYY